MKVKFKNNLELSRRINDQLDPKVEKKPLRFFMPS